MKLFLCLVLAAIATTFTGAIFHRGSGPRRHYDPSSFRNRLNLGPPASAILAVDDATNAAVRRV